MHLLAKSRHLNMLLLPIEIQVVVFFFHTGWLIKMTIEKSEELDGLMDQDAYDKFVKSLEE